MSSCNGGSGQKQPAEYEAFSEACVEGTLWREKGLQRGKARGKGEATRGVRDGLGAGRGGGGFGGTKGRRKCGSKSRGMWERGVRVWSVWCGRTGARDKEGNEEEKAEVTRGVRGISEVCGLGSEGWVVVVC